MAVVKDNMLNSPETTKLPADVQKAVEQARANLDMLHNETVRQDNNYRRLSKEVSLAETRLTWVDKALEEKKIFKQDLEKEITNLEIAKQKILQENIKIKDDTRSILENNAVKIKELSDWEKEIKNREQIIVTRETDHSTREARRVADQQILDTKKKLLQEVIQKI